MEKPMSLTLTAEIYSPRWGHTDTYAFELSKETMTVSMQAREAVCTWKDNFDPVWTGEQLQHILQNDSIYPPAIFQDLVEHLWKSWRNGELNSEQVNVELQELVSWLNEITKTKPRTDFWRTYF
jgi:hypothetical protein